MKKSTKVLLVTLAVAGAAAHAGVRVWSAVLEYERRRYASSSMTCLYASMYPDEYPDEDIDWDWD